jgi:hypothetical protein
MYIKPSGADAADDRFASSSLATKRTMTLKAFPGGCGTRGMRDVERDRYDAALRAFAEAFAKGYADGKRMLAAGELTRPMLKLPFSIDVPRRAVLDDEWSGYVQQFKDAGLRAALSLFREGEAHLDPTDAHENSPMCFFENTFRWHVIDRP